MPREFRFLIALLVACLGWASVSRAQTADPGDLGLYFNAEATVTGTSAAPGAPFQVYAISTWLPSGLEYFEFLIDVDERATVLEETILPGLGTPSDFGADPTPNRRNYLVGTGGVCVGARAMVTLVRLEVVLDASASDVLFCLEAAIPSTLVPPRPGFLPCVFDTAPFGRAHDGCVVVNPVAIQPPVAVHSVGWGALKARF